MAWIAPAVLGIIGAVSQNQANKAADVNNTAQQQGQVANAQAALTQAKQFMAPWLAPGPFSGANIGSAPGPIAMGQLPGAPQQQAPAQPQAAQQGGGQRQALGQKMVARPPQSGMGVPSTNQPTAGQPRPQLTPAQMQVFQQILAQRGAQRVM